MTDITINTPDGGSITLDGGTSWVFENTCRKESFITPLPLFGKDSDGTDVFDFGGTLKSINLAGIYVGSTVTECKNFIDSLEGLQQGNQSTQEGYPLTLTDPDTRGTPKVKVSECETSKEGGQPLIVRWSLKLIESSIRA